jgi:hypothetical protein
MCGLADKVSTWRSGDKPLAFNKGAVVAEIMASKAYHVTRV